ncbi:MAG: hypothetical protein GVY06_03365 [Alphaproteobacteria bacterium]|jgi:lipid A 3-O-deacylase|nr:hypothetical protein [Alphaproteobacteria bacterium]
MLAGTVAALPATANAQLLEEARLGVFQHNICVIDCKNADKEDGPNLEGELVLASPQILEFALSPRPFIVGSVNTAGKTSYGGAGLAWQFGFAGDWHFEPALAYVIHDGAVESPFPQGDPRSDAFSQENVLFGSEDLFRTSFSLGRDFGDNWGGQLTYEHLSHGQILGDGRNQGIDNIGLRLFWRFGR